MKTISPLFAPDRWRAVDGFDVADFTDITYHRAVDHGTVRIAFNRPEVRNAFRPQTVDELYRALDHARMSSDVGCVLITGNGPSPKETAARGALKSAEGFPARRARWYHSFQRR